MELHTTIKTINYRMKTDIILAGVGGQGILSIATVIGVAALEKNFSLKQAEVHGMSQRGGAVQSHLRISDQPIASDLIPLGKADLILSVEPMESLRYLSYLSSSGWLVTNETPFVNIPHYPDKEKILSAIRTLSRTILLPADQWAEECGTARASNMVMLGAAIPFLPFELEEMENAIRVIFGRKGEEIININLKAMKLGFSYAHSMTIL